MYFRGSDLEVRLFCHKTIVVSAVRATGHFIVVCVHCRMRSEKTLALHGWSSFMLHGLHPAYHLPTPLLPYQTSTSLSIRVALSCCYCLLTFTLSCNSCKQNSNKKSFQVSSRQFEVREVGRIAIQLHSWEVSDRLCACDTAVCTHSFRISQFHLFCCRYQVSISSWSKQLPTLVLFRGGKEVKRRPEIDIGGNVTRKFVMSEVCCSTSPIHSVGDLSRVLKLTGFLERCEYDLKWRIAFVGERNLCIWAEWAVSSVQEESHSEEE